MQGGRPGGRAQGAELVRERGKGGFKSRPFVFQGLDAIRLSEVGAPSGGGQVSPQLPKVQSDLKPSLLEDPPSFSTRAPDHGFVLVNGEVPCPGEVRDYVVCCNQTCR